MDRKTGLGPQALLQNSEKKNKNKNRNRKSTLKKRVMHYELLLSSSVCLDLELKQMPSVSSLYAHQPNLSLCCVE